MVREARVKARHCRLFGVLQPSLLEDFLESRGKGCLVWCAKGQEHRVLEGEGDLSCVRERAFPGSGRESLEAVQIRRTLDTGSENWEDLSSAS